MDPTRDLDPGHSAAWAKNAWTPRGVSLLHVIFKKPTFSKSPSFSKNPHGSDLPGIETYVKLSNLIIGQKMAHPAANLAKTVVDKVMIQYRKVFVSYKQKLIVCFSDK